MYPTNYFDVISDKVDEAIENFNLKYEDVDLNTLTDEGFTDSQWEDIDDIIMGIK